MRPNEMVRIRRPEWLELEAMLATFTRYRRRRKRPEELARFATLFRSVCADLARARAQGYPDDLVDYLNALAARSHNVFYVSPPQPFGAAWKFFKTTFPLAIRKNAAYFLAGLFLFYGPMIGMIALARSGDPVLYQIVPKSMLESMEKMYQKGHKKGRSEAQDMTMAGFYVKHNVGIAFDCFATGVFFGLGSIFVLLFNGIAIGAVVGFISNTGSAANLLSFIVGHGPFELTAICISGGAGLRLGLGAIFTGNRRRSDSLRIAAREAVQMVAGAAMLLLGAALIEGFFSPSGLPMAVKFAFGAICTLFLIWYLGIYAWRVGRRVAAEEQAAGR